MDIWGPRTDFGLSSDEMREVVDVHLAQHIGDYETAFADDEGWSGQSEEDGPPVDVLVVPPQGERLFGYVASFGCAFQCLPAEPYKTQKVCRHVEFVMAAQQLGEDEDKLRALNLTANTVRQFAKLVHLNGVTVEAGETVAFADDPKPVYDGAPFCAFAFMPPRLPGPGFDQMKITKSRMGEPVRYIAPVPIYREELEYGVANGPEALRDLLLDAGVTEMLDLQRPLALNEKQLKQVAKAMAQKEKATQPSFWKRMFGKAPKKADKA